MGRIIRSSVSLVLLLVAPLVLIGLALPRLLAGNQLPGVQAVLFDRIAARSIAPQRLEKAQAALASALPGDGVNELWRAELSALLAGMSKTRLREARAATIDGLADDPANPRGWTLLCELDIALRRDDAARCLDTAFFIGPFDWFVARRRTALSIHLWPQLDPDTKDAAARRLRLIWQTPGLRFIDVEAAQSANGKLMLAEALASDPGARVELSRLVRESR